MGVVFLMVALLLNATANILIKLGAGRLESLDPPLEQLDLIGKALAVGTNLYLVIGIIFFASNVGFYTLALKKLNLSAAYPIMTSGGFLLISAFSVLYLKETLTALQITGIVLIAVGIAFVAYHMNPS